MKKVYTISVFGFFLLLTNIVNASTNDGKTKENNEPETAKENLVTGNVEKRLDQPEVSLDNEKEEAQTVGETAAPKVKDSTNLNSVCKFNYIFYFIYKLKYDEEDNATGYIEYEF